MKKINILLLILIGNAINAIVMPNYCKWREKTYNATQPESRNITNVGFSFSNKAIVPYKIEVTNQTIANYQNNNTRTTTVNPGKRHNIKLDVSKPTTLKLIDTTTNSQHFFRFEPNKTIYVTWQGVLRPQTGPNQGKYGVTDDCFLKTNNVQCSTNAQTCDWQ